MQKPGFGVVTSVVTALCLLGFVATALRPHIPVVIANRMSAEKPEFMRQAQSETIDWKPMNKASLAEARRAGKPILLVIGTPTSRVGNILDEEAFSDREISGYLRRNFFCIRVDGAANPPWLNAFLPFKRLMLGFQPDLQIWALDPVGVPFDYLVRSQPDQTFDALALLPILIDLRNKFEALGDHRTGKNNMQRDEETVLESLSPKPVPFEDYATQLQNTFDRSSGGYTAQGIVAPTPLAWRYLLLTGDTSRMDQTIQTIFHTPLVDLMDGGFFHTLLNDPSGRWVEFDKKPVENAEAMLSLAQANALSPDQQKQEMVDETWDYLLRYARTKDGFAAGQYGPENPLRRSARYSFSSNRLRESVSPEVRDWTIKNLGLNVARFPQAVPFRQTADALGTPLMLALEDMRDAPAPQPQLAEPGLADVNFTCAARAIQTARILGKDERLRLAVQWVEGMELLHDGQDILAESGPGNHPPGYLGDYLAYADARLQDYLATGHVRSFEMGMAVLRRAKDLFAGMKPGIFVLNNPDRPMSVPYTSMPEIADNLHEACTARMIRLLLAYGRLMGDTPEGGEMQAVAHRSATLFCQLGVDGGARTAGLYCAAAEDADRAFAVAVGPDARKLANDLARRLPTRLVAPAFGSVREDLQTRPPGLYIVDGGIQGPYTVAEAQQHLSPVLKVEK